MLDADAARTHARAAPRLLPPPPLPAGEAARAPFLPATISLNFPAMTSFSCQDAAYDASAGVKRLSAPASPLTAAAVVPAAARAAPAAADAARLLLLMQASDGSAAYLYVASALASRLDEAVTDLASHGIVCAG